MEVVQTRTSGRFFAQFPRLIVHTTTGFISRDRGAGGGGWAGGTRAPPNISKIRVTCAPFQYWVTNGALSRNVKVAMQSLISPSSMKSCSSALHTAGLKNLLVTKKNSII